MAPSLRDVKYLCGCHLGENGIEICTLHLVIFSDLLKEFRYNQVGWDINQETYNKIILCLSADEEERKLLCEV